MPTDSIIGTYGPSDNIIGTYEADVNQITRVYPWTILADVPSVYYRLDDVSGSVAVDSSGNANNGTYAGGFTLGQSGATLDADTAALFNGTTGTMTCNVSVPAAVACTFETWINGNGHTWSSASEVALMSSGHAKVVQITVSGGSLFASVPVNSVNQSLTSANVFPTTGWHHVVLTWATGDFVRLYVDGVLDTIRSSVSTGVMNTITGISFAADGNGANPLTGLLDELAFYQTQLSATRVLAHYRAAVGPVPVSNTAVTGTVNPYG